MAPPGVAIVILAAGLARRMGEPKLLLPLGDRPLLGHVVHEAVRSGCSPVIVVASEHVKSRVGDWAPDDLPEGVQLVVNPRPEEGMSSSLKLGLRHVPGRAGAVIIALGDQPLVKAATFRRLADVHARSAASAVVPLYGGRPGHPVLFSAQLIPELLTVEGDRGGRDVLRRHRENTRFIPLDEPLAGTDVDTPEDLHRLRTALGFLPSPRDSRQP